MESRPNWRTLAATVQAMSTILAGFSFTLLVLALSKDVLTVSLDTPPFADTRSLALFCLATAGLILILSTECLLHSQSYDVWSLGSERLNFLRDKANSFGVPWPIWLDSRDKKVRSWYIRGSYLYYAGVLLFLLGGTFLVYPYSVISSLSIFAVGFLIELTWIIYLVAKR